MRITTRQLIREAMKDVACKHRGEKIDTDQCAACRRKGVRLNVYACAIYGKCIADGRGKTVKRSCMRCNRNTA